MAELMLKVEDGSGFEDGDIICAFNQKTISYQHAQMLCHPRIAPRNSAGLMLADTACHAFYANTHALLYERLDHNTLRTTVLATGVSSTMTNEPDRDGKYTDVALFVRRRRERADHHLFGEDGREFWYGGQLNFSQQALPVIWDAIQATSQHKAADFTQWPAGRLELRSHLFVTVDDFDDETQVELVSPLVTRQGATFIVEKKRQHQIAWQDALSLSVTDVVDVKNRETHVDLRERAVLNRSSVVLTKAAPLNR